MHIKIYTDGGCSGNPGPGGWAYIIVGDRSAKAGKGGDNSSVLAEKKGAEKDTTNNRMELRAASAALEALSLLRITPDKVTVYTDSQYVQKGMDTWIHSWKSKGWRTSSRDPVKNQDLWQRLDELAAPFSIQWVWVKGHAGNELNERCDRMAQEAIASLSGSGRKKPGQSLLFSLPVG
jgi:ribonuclease HI